MKKICAKEVFGSNLRLVRLGGKIVELSAGESPENDSVSVPTQWAALRAAHAFVGHMPTSQLLVGGGRLELPLHKGTWS